MHFHCYVRVKDGAEFQEILYAIPRRERGLIIPIVAPQTEVGKALLNDDYLRQVSIRSDVVRNKVDIIYIKGDDPTQYEQFLNAINKWAEIGIKGYIKDPTLIIILPGEWESFVLEDVGETDPEYLKRTLFGIVECFDSEAPDKQLRRFFKRRRLSNFYALNAEQIELLFKTVLSLFFTTTKPG